MSEIDIKRISYLAKLKLPREKEEFYANSLKDIIKWVDNLKKIDTFVEDKSEININNSTFENISIWNSFNFNKIRKTNFVFFSRSGSSIYQFQK